MLFENENFEIKLDRSSKGPDNVYRYCNFKNISTEGDSYGDIFVGCVFENIDMYWGMFNTTILVNVKFVKCQFRGVAFSGSKFYEFEFNACEFLKDNLNGECTFDEVTWYKCRQFDCVGLEKEFRNK